MIEDTEPCYVISVAARMIGVHAQTLRYYERLGLIEPHRSKGKIRFYSSRDIERIRRIKTLMNDLGVNLSGVEVILRMAERMAEMEHAMREMEQKLERLRGSVPPTNAPDPKDAKPARAKKSSRERRSSSKGGVEQIPVK